MVLTICVFFEVFFHFQVFYFGDNFYLNAPMKVILVNAIQHGRLPLWNPYIFLGQPYFADMNLGTLYPLNFLYFIFDVWKALTLQAVLDIFLICIGTFLLLRQMKLSYLASLFGAIIVGFSGEVFGFSNNITILNVIVYIPFLFLFARLFIERKKWLYLHILIFFQALQIVSGHPQITYYSILFVSLYLFFLLEYSFKKKILVVGYYLLSPLFLSAIQLIPAIEMTRLSTRAVVSYQYATSGSLGIFDFVTFLFPTFYGNLVDGTWWGKQEMLVGYIGIIPLLLLFLSIQLKKTKEIKLFLSMIGFCLLVALGNHTPIFHLFYWLIPGWKFFRDPERILIFYSFFGAIVSAYGFEILKKKKFTFKSIWLSWKMIGTYSVIVGVLIISYIIFNNSLFWPGVLRKISPHIHLASKLFVFSPLKIQIIFQNWLLNVIIFLFSIVTFIFILKSKLSTALKAFLIIIATASALLYFDSKVVLTTSEKIFQEKPVLSNHGGNYRILSLPVDLHQSRANIPGPDYFLREAKANLAIERADTNILSGDFQIDGYASSVPRDFVEYISTDKNNITGVTVDLNNQEKLHATGVKYVLSDHPIIQLNSWNETFVMRKENNYFLYENQDAIPIKNEKLFSRMQYEIETFRIGLIISAISFIVLIILTIFYKKKIITSGRN